MSWIDAALEKVDDFNAISGNLLSKLLSLDG